MKAKRSRRNNSNADASAGLHLDDALSAARAGFEEELWRVKERTQAVAYQAIIRAPVNNKLNLLATHLGMWGRESGEIASRWLQEYLKLGIANQEEISGNPV